MSSIVTFYSYKGGVGRSMALANTAVLLAKSGAKVLVVDWDLEAPGIERYFSYFKIDSTGAGLLNYLIDVANRPRTDYRDYLWTIDGEGAQFSLLASGKDVDSRYSYNLERFNWQKFFEQGGGDLLENLRNQWRAAYDFVLIDSRTGLSDSGGICTIQMPDIVVAIFTPNQQSLYGVRDVMRLAQTARQSLAYDRMQLSVIPLPSRFGKTTELLELQEWRDRSADAMEEFYRDWLPKWASCRETVERLSIPQIDYFGFGEKLAVIEQGTTDPSGMGFVYDRLASLLKSDLRDAEQILQLKESVPAPIAPKAVDDYEYDLFVSYAHSPVTEEWLRPFIALLNDYLSELKGEPAKIFFDYREISMGSIFPAAIREALSRSRLLAAILTPSYFNSEACVAEWATFSARQERSYHSPLIVPVLLAGEVDRLPGWVLDRKFIDVRKLFAQGTRALLQKRPSYAVLEAVQQVALEVHGALREVPPFNANAPVIAPGATRFPAGTRERILDALAEPKFVWRSLEALAGKGTVTPAQVLELLQAEPSVVLGKGKSGRTIARLKTRLPK